MELNQNFTKPTVRSVLSFTEKELINALQEYAEENGYSFQKKNSEYAVWHPNRRGSGEYLTKLVVDIDGNNEAILEEQK